MKDHHPLFRRLLWHPLIVAVPFGYLLYRTYLGRAGAGGIAGLAFVGLWFGLSVFDWLTAHSWLNWLYSDEMPDPTESEPQER